MITVPPPHRFKIPFFLAGPRSATAALVQICLCHVNVAIDSSWLTADSRTCDGPIMRRNVVSQHTHRRRLPSPTSVVRKPP